MKVDDAARGHPFALLRSIMSFRAKLVVPGRERHSTDAPLALPKVSTPPSMARLVVSGLLAGRARILAR
jgi:hypothetical protein